MLGNKGRKAFREILSEDREVTISRPSDRVHGCGTAQVGQTHTITHDLRKFVKSSTIRKCLLEISIKRGISIEYQDF